MVNTSDCGSDIRGFDSPHSPIFLGYSQAVRQGTLTPSCVGSNPATPVILCRRGGIGRRAGLKIQCPQGRAGSTPAAGIVCLKVLLCRAFLLPFYSFPKRYLKLLVNFYYSSLVNSSASSSLITRVPEVKLFGLAQTKYLRFYTCEFVYVCH